MVIRVTPMYATKNFKVFKDMLKYHLFPLYLLMCKQITEKHVTFFIG